MSKYCYLLALPHRFANYCYWFGGAWQRNHSHRFPDLGWCREGEERSCAFGWLYKLGTSAPVY
jgi:hypothetical protein